MFRHEESSECRFQTSCNLKRCQFKHPYITDRLATKDRNECETSDEEELDNHDEDDEATDYETIDYVQVNENDLRDLEFKECGACSTVLTIENSYKCKTCGEPKHRSNCNKWFNTVKKHYYCGGCVYAFEPETDASR